MTPTNELRFVERQQSEPITEYVNRVYTIRVLQQKWINEHDKFGEGEWRDVPLVKEELK